MIRDFIKRSLIGDAPVERSDLYDSQVGDFWANLASITGASNPTLLERVWVANRCLQMNANAISEMPLRHYGGDDPAWVSNPDPVWFPNGIGDAVFAIVWSLYGWGDAFVYITARDREGWPTAWTVLDPATIAVESKGGQRVYRQSNQPLIESDMVQISRDPRGRLRGTSAISSYSAYTNSLLAAADLGRVMMATSTPATVLKPKRKISKEQAEALQLAWVTATSARRGAPAIIPPDIDFEKLAFSPQDLMLLDVQKFDAQVIATAFGVPATMVNMPIEGGLNYQTPLLALEQWWRVELRPTTFRISHALNSNMLPAGQYVKFDPYEFIAPTWTELVTGWAALLDAKIVTVEEARAVVLQLPPRVQEDALAILAVPSSADASPATLSERRRAHAR